MRLEPLSPPDENSSPIPSHFTDLAGAFLDAAEAIERCGSEAADGATPFQRQAATLNRWAEERARLIPPEGLSDQKFQFQPFPSDPLKLYLPAATIAELIQSQNWEEV